ncbi:MAG: hypothetical protein K9K65_01435 [Desulfarculaceae bacterium]|nr:hypothetical protein [Desulfarculaceae bacterium]MCF8046484.1 hypothetical protein [Desulfarculaceae bacterium]MCF8096479.1 hypothetical protein [Desulfarculaceae bacterium]MCF8121031.1 hypothetical protein [Desulfarculaceae bacterium]
MTRLRITGWKHRRELSLLALKDWPWAGVNSLAGALAQAHINLPFLLMQTGKGGVWVRLCLEQGKRPQAQALAAELAQDHGWEPPLISEPVIALTFYPLAGGMTLPAEALACLAGAGLHPLALGTSLAAMTVILPEEMLPAAVQALGSRFDLPPGSSPPEERVSVVQSPVKREG